MRFSRLDHRSDDRLSIRCPREIALQAERTRDRSRVGAVGLDHIETGQVLLFCSERDIASILRNCRAADDKRPLTMPEFRSGFALSLPKALAGAVLRHVKKEV